jgi:hypothetical protein
MSRVFWDIEPCSLLGVDRRFRGAYFVHQVYNPVDQDAEERKKMWEEKRKVKMKKKEENYKGKLRSKLLELLYFWRHLIPSYPVPPSTTKVLAALQSGYYCQEFA